MLNISHTSTSKYILKRNYSTINNVESKTSTKVLRKIMYTGFALLLIIMFLPWTQSIRSKGSVITLRPDQRPQTINSVIGGRVDTWFVQEGDFVSKGDTLLKITEIKDDYFDEKLLSRTAEQLSLKKESVVNYDDKINTQTQQLDVVSRQRDLKLSQAKIKLSQATLKVQNDSIAYEAAKINSTTAQYQYNRYDSLYKKGFKSLTDLETKNIKLQQTKSYEIEAKNKWLNSQNELVNLQIELANVNMKFKENYNKILSDKYSTISGKLDTETNLSKLETQYRNYEFRNGLYFILAPQDGYITKTLKRGIGEILKEGESILTVMPSNYDLAVEIFVDPIDLPLVNIGEKVMIQFDGWPAIVFSGWPNASHGTYSGEIYAMDQFISENGKYRILVSPDPSSFPWPKALRFGSGTSSLILLNDVPIYYELWRNINGFPPDYYTVDLKKTDQKKK